VEPQWLAQLGELVQQLWSLLRLLWELVLPLLPVLLWLAFWLFAVDWRKLWPVLAQGAWAPCVLLGLIIATAWSRIAPSECDCLRFATIPNFWWQLGGVSTLAALALFAGWLQSQWHYQPPEIAIEPPPPEHGHAHGHH
jgi:hypothetical protein